MTMHDENSGETPADREQEHGGTLRSGNPGNAGGGRPSSVVRNLAREALVTRLPTLTKIIDDENAPVRERLRALELLAKWSGVERLGSMTDAEAFLHDVAGALGPPSGPDA